MLKNSRGGLRWAGVTSAEFGRIQLSERPARWFLPGGWIVLIKPAAHREACEETGHDDIRMGPMVWHGDQVLMMGGEPVLHDETFVVAHAQRSEMSDERWSVSEHSNAARKEHLKSGQFG